MKCPKIIAARQFRFAAERAYYLASRGRDDIRDGSPGTGGRPGRPTPRKEDPHEGSDQPEVRPDAVRHQSLTSCFRPWSKRQDRSSALRSCRHGLSPTTGDTRDDSLEVLRGQVCRTLQQSFPCLYADGLTPHAACAALGLCQCGATGGHAQSIYRALGADEAERNHQDWACSHESRCYLCCEELIPPGGTHWMHHR